jgi:hypothetical protein
MKHIERVRQISNNEDQMFKNVLERYENIKWYQNMFE